MIIKHKFKDIPGYKEVRVKYRHKRDYGYASIFTIAKEVNELMIYGKQRFSNCDFWVEIVSYVKDTEKVVNGIIYDTKHIHFDAELAADLHEVMRRVNENKAFRRSNARS